MICMVLFQKEDVRRLWVSGREIKINPRLQRVKIVTQIKNEGNENDSTLWSNYDDSLLQISGLVKLENETCQNIFDGNKSRIV